MKSVTSITGHKVNALPMILHALNATTETTDCCRSKTPSAGRSRQTTVSMGMQNIVTMYM